MLLLARGFAICQGVPAPPIAGSPSDAARPTATVPATQAIQATASQSARKIHVVVVAVPKFSIPGYNTTVISQTFQERCDEIKTYFESHLGVANVQVDRYCTPLTTTREALRRLFAIDIPKFSANTVTLLFIMSHGEQVHFNNDFVSSDVELITSDTRITDDGDDADGERHFSSILVGSEMFTWLETAPQGSTILTFLDFCHSGAAASLSSSITQFLQQQYGLRSLVVSSSLPSDNTYRALFTQSLLSMWDAPSGCINLDTMPTSIYNMMREQAPLTNSEGLPIVLVHYQGPLCLGNFGGDHKLLFIYAGQGAETTPYKYQISTVGSTQKVITSSLLSSTYLPIPLDRGQYSVSVNRNDTLIGTWDVDLSSQQTQIIWLDSTAAPGDLGKFAEQAATTAAHVGMGEGEVDRLRATAAAVYQVAGLNDDAKRVQSVMASSGHPLISYVTPEAAQIAANPSSQAVAQSATANDSEQSLKVANGLKLLGDFKSAASLLQAAAAKEQEKVKQGVIAAQAYQVFVALGDVKSAASVKRRFLLDDQQLKPINLNITNSAAGVSAARTAGIAGALGALVANP